jgi:hypothetical protein
VNKERLRQAIEVLEEAVRINPTVAAGRGPARDGLAEANGRIKALHGAIGIAVLEIGKAVDQDD